MMSPVGRAWYPKSRRECDFDNEKGGGGPKIQKFCGRHMCMVPYFVRLAVAHDVAAAAAVVVAINIDVV